MFSQRLIPQISHKLYLLLQEANSLLSERKNIISNWLKKDMLEHIFLKFLIFWNDSFPHFKQQQQQQQQQHVWTW